MTMGGRADRTRADSAADLVSAEEHYWLLLERLPVVVYAAAMDATGGNIKTTAHAMEIYGIPAEDFDRDPELWQKVIHPEDRQRVTAAYSAAVASRSPFHEEYRILRPDGTIRWVRDDSRPATSTTGRELMYGVLIDVHTEREAIESLRHSEADLERRVRSRTAEVEEVNRTLLDEVGHRRRSEAEIGALEARYRSLVEQLPAVVYLDEILPGGEVRPMFIGPQVLALTGRRSEDILDSQRSWHDIVHPDDRERVRREDAEHVGVEAAHSREYRVVDRDGHVHWVLDECRVVPPSDGLPGYDQGVLIDVTQQRLAAGELRRLTDLHARILDSTAEGIYGLDRDGRVTFINHAGAALLGRTAGELIGKLMHPITHDRRPDGTPYPIEQCPIYAALRDGASHAVDDDTFWRPDGSPIPVAYKSNPIVIDGEITGVVVVFSDVTARRDAASQLLRLNEDLERRVAERTAEIARAEARWRSLIDSAPGYIFTIDREGRLTYLSRTAGDSGADELVGTPLVALVQERSRPAVEAALDAVFERGEQASYEAAAAFPDGGSSWFEAQLARSGENEAVGFAVDVTERRRAREARLVEYAVATALAESSGLSDAAGEVLAVIGEIMGWDLGEFWQVDDGAETLLRIATWSRPGLETRDFEARTRQIEHERRPGLPAITWQHGEPMLWSPIPGEFPRAAVAASIGLHGAIGLPVLVGERVVGVILFFAADLGPVEEELLLLRSIGATIGQAVERWRTAEALVAARDEAEQANRAKSEMLSRMSHELRTPLNAILGFGQLLELADLEPLDRDSVDQMMNAGRNLLRLVDRVLEVARLDTGRSSLIFEPVLVDEVARVAVEANRAGARDLQVTVTVRAADPDVAAWCDSARTSAILGVLVSNAVTHNRQAGTADISWRTDRGRVVIDVTDTGPGIEPERLDRIFTPFDAAVDGRRGTVAGLSLALARRHAETMGGRLTVRSTVGKGTVFSLELPLATGGGAPDGHQVLALVGELTRAIVAAELRAIPGLRLAIAVSEATALELARSYPPSLLLIEIGDGDSPGRLDQVWAAMPAQAPSTIVLDRRLRPEDRAMVLKQGVQLLEWPAQQGDLAALVAARLAELEGRLPS